jgi:DNA-binding NarL/FixJ family response regulator
VTERVLDRIRHQEDDDELSALTERERSVLELIAEGLTNRQIGVRLFVSEKTVKNYVSSVLSKLGMSRRTEAAAYSARLSERRSQDGSAEQVAHALTG